MSRDPFERSEGNQQSTQEGKGWQETAENLKDRLKDVSSGAKDKASQLAQTVSEKIDSQRETAASGLGRAASALHESANRIPGGAKATDAGHRIAEGMESTAQYIKDHNLSAMGSDAVDSCRRYPTQSLLAALAVGFLIGRSRRN